MRIREQFKKFNFHINWTLLSVGYYGYANIPHLILKQDICEYALEIFELMGTDFELFSQILSVGNDVNEFEENLDKLVKMENVDYDVQVRKWRVYLVDQELKNLSNDYFEGLISLTELWISLGLPNDRPQIIQGLNNTYSPEEYYTKEMYELMVKNNWKWLENEIITINSTES